MKLQKWSLVFPTRSRNESVAMNKLEMVLRSWKQLLHSRDLIASSIPFQYMFKTNLRTLMLIRFFKFHFMFDLLLFCKSFSFKLILIRVRHFQIARAKFVCFFQKSDLISNTELLNMHKSNGGFATSDLWFTAFILQIHLFMAPNFLSLTRPQWLKPQRCKQIMW